MVLHKAASFSLQLCVIWTPCQPGGEGVAARHSNIVSNREEEKNYRMGESSVSPAPYKDPESM